MVDEVSLPNEDIAAVQLINNAIHNLAHLAEANASLRTTEGRDPASSLAVKSLDMAMIELSKLVAETAKSMRTRRANPPAVPNKKAH